LAVLGEEVQITMYRGSTEYVFDANVTLNSGKRLGLRFPEMNLEQSINFVQCTFARADSWAVWSDKRERDTPLRGLVEVVFLGFRGLKMFSGIALRPLLPKRRSAPNAPQSGSLTAQAQASTSVKP
jgi:cellulose synthase (UDP-forming)